MMQRPLQRRYVPVVGLHVNKGVTMERNVVFISLFAALIAVLGLLPKLTLGFGVPITAQSLGVMLAGTVLGSKRGFLSVLLFVAISLMGMPILAGGRTGLESLQSATVGFLIGFPIAAFVCGLIAEIGQKINVIFISFIAAVLGGVVVLYFCGIIGLAWKLDKTLLEAMSLVMVFIPGDFIKAILAAVITFSIFKARPDVVFSRN